jgi:hypothetical protein
VSRRWGFDDGACFTAVWIDHFRDGDPLLAGLSTVAKPSPILG